VPIAKSVSRLGRTYESAAVAGSDAGAAAGDDGGTVVGLWQ
jgi:hypothetical protein